MSKLQQKQIVELGSGSGLVGLTCWKKCNPSSLILTDFHPKVLETLLENVKNNIGASVLHFENQSGISYLFGKRVSIQSLDWTEFFEEEIDRQIEGDFILASGSIKSTKYLICTVHLCIIYILRCRLRHGSDFFTC